MLEPINKNAFKPIWALGYSSRFTQPKGTCFGQSIMAANAFLIDDISTFENRRKKILQLLYQFSSWGTFNNKEFTKWVKKNSNRLFLHKLLTDAGYEITYTVDELLLIDLRAYGDSVMVCQSARECADVFNVPSNEARQNISLVVPFAMSITLEEQIGICSHNSIIGFYNLEELHEYFDSIQSTAHRLTSGNIDNISIILRSSDHSLTVNYNTLVKCWMVFDARFEGIYKFSDLTDLPRIVIYLLTLNEDFFNKNTTFMTNKNTICMTSSILEAANKKETFEELKYKLNELSSWQQIHAITPAKAKAIDSAGKNLLIHAVRENNAYLFELLLKQGALVNHLHPTFGISALIIAAQDNATYFIRRLIEEGVQVDSKEYLHGSPLWYAALLGHIESAKLLIKYGANVNCINSAALKKSAVFLYKTPLMAAISAGEIDLIQLLLESNATFSGDEEELSTTIKKVFELAILFDKITVFSWIIQNYSHYFDFKKSPTDYIEQLLDLAYLYGRAASIAWLIDQGVDIQILTKRYNMLINTIQNKQWPLASVLIERDIAVHETDAQGDTPLLAAVSMGEANIIKMLIDKGADIHHSNKSGETAVFLAAKLGHIEALDILVRQGAFIDAAYGANNVTPLYVAAENGHEEIVKFLILNKANTEISAADSSTALWIAAKNGHLGIVQALYNARASIQVENRQAQNPVWIAANYGHDNVVSFLLKKGCPIKRSAEKISPLQAAYNSLNFRTIKIINAHLAQQAKVNMVVKQANISTSPASIHIQIANLFTSYAHAPFFSNRHKNLQILAENISQELKRYGILDKKESLAIIEDAIQYAIRTKLINVINPYGTFQGLIEYMEARLFDENSFCHNYRLCT
jgi:ankyrin repeat protein